MYVCSQVSSTQHCLPQLASYVDTSHPLYTQGKSTKALAAVTALHKLHAVRKMGPRPWSLLLEQVRHRIITLILSFY